MKKIVGMAAFMLLSTGLLTGCGEKIKPGTEAVRREPVSGVTVQAAALAPVDEYYETSGTVRAKTVSTVASRVMGTITSMQVKEGDRVAAGQLLLTIDDADMAMKVQGAVEGQSEALKGLEAARENMKLRETTWQRYKRLYDEKALSKQELDQIELQKTVAALDYERAQAAVNRVSSGVGEAKIYHGYTRVKAPAAGLVTAKKAETGSMAVPGMPLLIIEDTSSYRIEVNADEKLSGKIRPGMEVKLAIDALPQEIAGVVTDVVQAIDPASRSFLVKITLKHGGSPERQVYSGLYARVRIPIGRRQVLSVPKTAVVEKGQLTGVYIVSPEGILTYRLVRTGGSSGDTIEILSGINPGDSVVVAGVEKAVDGGIVVKQP